MTPPSERAVFRFAPSPNGDTFGQWATPAIGAGVALCALTLPDRWRVLGGGRGAA